ncbi:MAG: hypothetical protein AAFQ87_06400, partial [Bacteroidota bacterium]
YLEYSNSLSKLIEWKPFRQWINGSFISQDGNPRDIDLVNLIDYQVVDLYEPQLRKFISNEARETYAVDGYIVKLYPSEHPYFSRTQADLLYWEH